jgi:hypothetical protein
MITGCWAQPVDFVQMFGKHQNCFLVGRGGLRQITKHPPDLEDQGEG